MLGHLYLFIVLVCLVAVGECENCIHNLRVVGSTSTSVTVSWDYDCPVKDGRMSVKDGRMSVKYGRVSVIYQHVSHLGCRNMTYYSKDRMSAGEVQVKNKTQATLRHLNSFSEYLIKVKDLSTREEEANASITVNTRSSIPDVAPDASTTQYDYKTTSNRLFFNWRAPRRSSCSQFHGRVSGYSYQLVGVEEWSNHVRRSGQVLGFTSTSVQFDDLVPFSQYVMHVYLTVEGGGFNEDHYLKMEKSTEAGHPNKPRQLDVISAYKQSFHLMWRPPYPPTGDISSYTIRWKEPEAPDWMGSQVVPPKSSLCRDDINSNNICHNINSLPSDKYIFQVQATNQGVKQPSPWDQTLWDKQEEMNKQLMIHLQQNNDEKKEEEINSHLPKNNTEDSTRTGISITKVEGITEANIITKAQSFATENYDVTVTKHVDKDTSTSFVEAATEKYTVTAIKDVDKNTSARVSEAATEKYSVTAIKDVDKNTSASVAEAETITTEVASIGDDIENNTNHREPRILAQNTTTLFTLIKNPTKETNTSLETTILSDKDKMLSLSKSIISMQAVFIGVVCVMASILILLLIYVSLRCRTQVKGNSPSRQSSMRTYSTAAGSQCEESEIYRSKRTREFVHLTRRYTQDPLPPVPDEHIYSDLRPRKEKLDSDLEEFIYLPPKPALLDEAGDEEEEEYLKTNFHTYKRIDTSASPTKDMEPPIPIRSYDSREVFASKLNLSEHLCTIT